MSCGRTHGEDEASTTSAMIDRLRQDGVRLCRPANPEGECERVSVDPVTVPVARAIERDLSALGILVSWAPDHEDRSLAWIYVTLPEDPDRDARARGARRDQAQRGTPSQPCETPEERVIDMSFEAATDVTSIRYRLAPIDVGFDLRAEGVEVVIDAAEYPLRVSYADDEGERRVLEGSRREVVDRLRALGYVVRSSEASA